MALVETAVATVHLLVGALWVGSVVFFALAVLPRAAEGDLNAVPLGGLAGSLTTWSRAAAVLMLLTGGHLAGTRYTPGRLVGSSDGYLVLAMLVLWLALAALVEVGASRIRDGVDERKVRTPARAARTPFLAAALVGLLLLIDAGILLG